MYTTCIMKQRRGGNISWLFKDEIDVTHYFSVTDSISPPRDRLTSLYSHVTKYRREYNEFLEKTSPLEFQVHADHIKVPVVTYAKGHGFKLFHMTLKSQMNKTSKLGNHSEIKSILEYVFGEEELKQVPRRFDMLFCRAHGQQCLFALPHKIGGRTLALLNAVGVQKHDFEDDTYLYGLGSEETIRFVTSMSFRSAKMRSGKANFNKTCCAFSCGKWKLFFDKTELMNEDIVYEYIQKSADSENSRVSKKLKREMLENDNVCDNPSKRPLYAGKGPLFVQSQQVASTAGKRPSYAGKGPLFVQSQQVVSTAGKQPLGKCLAGKKCMPYEESCSELDMESGELIEFKMASFSEDTKQYIRQILIKLEEKGYVLDHGTEMFTTVIDELGVDETDSELMRRFDDILIFS